MALEKQSVSLKELLESNDVHDDVLDNLAKAPFNITSVKQFANFFETKQEIKTLFLDSLSEYNDLGAVAANLKGAWREAEALTQRSIKRNSEGLPDENMDDPLREAVDSGLKAIFSAAYRFDIPPTWLGVPSLIGRLHREFQKRSHVATKVEQVRTLSQMHEGKSGVKKQRLGANLELLIGNPEVSNNTSLPYHYIMALQALLYSMAFAGSYAVGEAVPGKKDDKGVAALQLPLQPCLLYLADAQKFVASHAGKSSDQSILAALRKIDETIREKWADTFRSSTLSFGGVIESTGPFAATLWMAPGSVAGHQQSSNHHMQHQQQSGRHNQGSGKGSNSGSKGQKAFKGNSSDFVSKVNKNSSGKGQSKAWPKTARADATGKLYCKSWNDNRDGVGCHFGTNCAAKHACDLLLPTGLPCDSVQHRRCAHK